MSTLTRPFSRLHLSQPTIPLPRPFSTTSPTLALSSDALLARKHRNITPYPYGPSRWYKQSNYGLYAGRRLRFGNNVSSKTEIKTRRKWEPNVRYKRLYSEALGKMIRVRIVTRLLRTIDKVGGLDNYLLGEKSRRVRELGMAGWALRWRLMQTEVVRERLRKERKRLGLAGKAPWEIESREEALAEGWAPEMVGMTAEEVRELARGVDEVLDRDEALGEEGGFDLNGEADLVVDEEEVEAQRFMAEDQPPQEIKKRDLAL